MSSDAVNEKLRQRNKGLDGNDLDNTQNDDELDENLA